jgi:uncharacterized protein YbjT (DUF2867 family)
MPAGCRSMVIFGLGKHVGITRTHPRSCIAIQPEIIMKKIVVTTPTGNIGSRVVQLLLQAGVRPTLLVRDPGRLSEWVRSTCDIRQGDLSEQDFVIETTRGADALFWLIPTNYGAADPVAEVLRLGTIAAAAVQSNQIERTVFLSSSGAEQRGNHLLGTLGLVEDLLNATGQNVVHLRPGYLYTNLFTVVEELRAGVLTTTTSVDHRAGWNDPRDVGEIAAARLLSDSWSGQQFQPIGGPADLSYREVAAFVGESIGRTIQAIQISEEEHLQNLLGAGLPAPVAEALVVLSRTIASIKPEDLGRSDSSTTPTSLGAWCYSHLRPLFL